MGAVGLGDTIATAAARADVVTVESAETPPRVVGWILPDGTRVERSAWRTLAQWMRETAGPVSLLDELEMYA